MKTFKYKLQDNVFKIAFLALILISFVYILFPFIPALIMGAILALALSSLVQKLESRGLSRVTSLRVLMSALFAIVLAPTLAFLVRGSTVLTAAIQDPNIMNKIKTVQNQIMQTIAKYAPTFGISPQDINQYLDQSLAKVTNFVLHIFSSLMSEVPNLLMYALITLVSLYFYLLHETKIKSLFFEYFQFSEGKGDQLLKLLKASCREVFLSNVLTGILQALVVTIGAAVFQLNEWFLIFFVTFIASFIPVLGAGPVAFVISAYCFISGDTTAGVGMLIISFVSGTADNIIRPYLASMGEVELPGFISFLAVIGGVITMGLPGLFLGPLIASLAFGIVPILTDDL